MSIVSIILPKMGEAIHEATLIKWRKKKGESITKDESIAEIATDKIDSEVVATESGIVEELFFKEGDIIPIGATLCTVATTNIENSSIPNTEIQEEKKISPKPVIEISTPPVVEKISVEASTTNSKKLKNSFLSPLLKKIIEKEKISQQELAQIKGTGQKKRITKDDIYSYLKKRNIETNRDVQEETPSKKPFINAFIDDKDESCITQKEVLLTTPLNTANAEIVEMDRMRKIIAKHMIDSKKISAHVTSFAEVDVTKIVEWRNKHKKKILEERNIKLTYTPIFLEAIVQSLLKFPILNSSVEDDKIYIKKNIHLGLATALPNNNLIVPVIKFAEGYNLLGLATQIEQLSSAARTGKLLPDQIQEGTFTVTNLGSINMMMGTPIIHQPQVAILGLGTIKKRPIIKETPEQDIITIGNMMYLSFSYDHRIIDGKIAGDFLNDLIQRMENFSLPTI